MTAVTQPKSTNSSTSDSSETSVDHCPQTTPGPQWSRRVVKIAWYVLAIFVATAFVVYGIYLTTQTEPEFYAQVMSITDDELAMAGDEFESEILMLQNQIQATDAWSATLDQQEINGWLAIDCPAKFPELIPRNASKPRIQILNSEIRMAFRYRSARFQGIISITGDVFIAEETGDLAVRIKKANSGLIPLPIGVFADRITRHLRNSGIAVEWTELNNDPVALLSIPEETFTLGDQIISVESINCRDGFVELVGTSVAKDSTKLD